MKCKEIQEKDKINLQLLNNKKVQKLKERGITLIALVVTIIILLILAGVTLNIAMSGDGLFSRARNATDKYKKAQEDEQDLISEIGKEMNSEYVGAFVTGYKPNKIIFTNDNNVPEEISTKIKTFENTENETETMKWRIWDFDGRILRLISETPTTAKLELNGVDDYNYGVYEMNQICRDCFGVHDENNNLKSGISVSNLKRSDIQKVSTYDYTKFKQNLSGDNESNMISFGDERTLSDVENVPEKWLEKDSKWSLSEDDDCLSWENEELISKAQDEESSFTGIFKYTFYTYGYTKNDFNNKKYLDLIFRNGEGNLFETRYWLGTRVFEYLSTNGQAACFSFGDVNSGDGSESMIVGAWPCYCWNCERNKWSLKLRPVVTIDLQKTGWKLTSNTNGSYTLETNI